MFIRSERLFLRPAWPEDWAELHAIIDDEAIVRNLARAPWPYGPEDARWFASQPQDLRHPHFFVTLPGAHGSRLIGCAGLAPAEQGGVELGYWIARSHWGRGYATEAARAVLNVARAIGHDRIEASHFIDNPASGQVLLKAGFRPTGEWRPRYSASRRTVCTSVMFETLLSPAGNGDGDGNDSGGQSEEVMRAA
ncbi:GNAT family N-acetyltransferase [Novosphingobium olei]|uniref:GNAT family N-acetyltransferase n=1 Tax=Novosphingobium olei TaxID=2728851 RepID=UPI00308B5B28|nr:GNAT family N-acetyltransferase [Novosphingobium olei]